MGRKVTDENLEFIKKNWLTMSNVDMARHIGVDPVRISQIGKELGLHNKSKAEVRQYSYERTLFSPDIINYNYGPDTMQELEARRKTLELLELKDKLNVRDKLKLRVIGNNKNETIRNARGTIVGKNDYFIAVKLKNYTECFAYTDFLIGKAVIL